MRVKLILFLFMLASGNVAAGVQGSLQQLAQNFGLGQSEGTELQLERLLRRQQLSTF